MDDIEKPAQGAVALAEREAFEKWKADKAQRCHSGRYSPSPWEAWQARASLATAPEPVTEEWAASLLGIPFQPRSEFNSTEIPRVELTVAEFSAYQRERIACVLRGARAVAATPVPSPVMAGRSVYLVATGETIDGRETYTRHESPPPLCDYERLYSLPEPLEGEG
jgi:hypothetical protein